MTKHVAEQMNMTSASVPHDTDEFTISGLTGRSRKSRCAAVGESLVSFSNAS